MTFQTPKVLFSPKPEWWNWQTRRTQNPLSFGTCGFKSHLRHFQPPRMYLPDGMLMFTSSSPTSCTFNPLRKWGTLIPQSNTNHIKLSAPARVRDDCYSHHFSLEKLPRSAQVGDNFRYPIHHTDIYATTKVGDADPTIEHNPYQTLRTSASGGR